MVAVLPLSSPTKVPVRLSTDQALQWVETRVLFVGYQLTPNSQVSASPPVGLSL